MVLGSLVPPERLRPPREVDGFDPSGVALLLLEAAAAASAAPAAVALLSPEVSPLVALVAVDGASVAIVSPAAALLLSDVPVPALLGDPLDPFPFPLDAFFAGALPPLSMPGRSPSRLDR